MKKYGFGVDIGGTTCKIGLFETTGNLVEKWEIPTNTCEEGKNILPDIAASLQEKMAEKKIGKEEIEGIGIGLPGPVQPDGSVPLCVNLGWKNKNIPEEMGGLMDHIPVKAGNDANVAALGEMWQGGGKGCKSLVMVTTRSTPWAASGAPAWAAVLSLMRKSWRELMEQAEKSGTLR